MKPLTLELNNFGPFLNEVLDFKNLNESLFLITGPTGSGKSTVFDGICYALYGESSGNIKPPDQLKSHFAAPDATMSVRYTFALQNKVYSIVRIPEQERKSQRGEGLARQAHEATLLEIIDGQEKVLASSVSKVATKVTELVGLNAAQFRQIVMLPQGEFSKLLKSKQDEKEKLLKSIFNMKVFEDFKEEVGLRYRARREDNRGKRKQLESEKSHFIWPIEELGVENGNDFVENAQEWINRDQLIAEADEKAIEHLEKNIAEADKHLQYKRNLEHDFIDLQAALQKEKRLQAAEQAMRDLQESHQRYKNVQQLLPLYTEWQAGVDALQKSEQRMSELAIAISNSEEALSAAEENYRYYQSEDYAKVQDNRQKKRDNLADYIIYVTRQRKLEDEIIKYTDQLKIMEKDGEKYADLNEKKDRLLSKKQSLNKVAIALLKNENDLRQTRQDLDHQIQALETLIELENNLSQKKADKKHLTSEYKDLRTQGKALQDKLLAMEAAIEKEKAATLSENLREGEPCPVCGSTCHPRPAKKQSTVNREAYQNLKKSWEALRDQLTAVKTNGIHLQQLILEQQATIRDHLNRWPDFRIAPSANYSEYLANLKDRQSATLKRQEALKTKQRELTEQENILEKQEDLLKTYLEKKVSWEKQHSDLRARLDEERGKEKENAERLAEKVATLTDADLTEPLEDRVKNIQEQIEKDKQRKTRTESDFIQKQNIYNKQISERELIKERLTGLKDRNRNYADKVRSAMKSFKLTEEDFTTTLPDEAQMAADEKQLENYRAEKSANTQTVKSLKVRLAGKKREDLKPLEAALKEQRELLLAKHKDKTLRKERLAQNKKTLKKIIGLHDQLQLSEKKEVFYRNLEQTVRGTLSGSKRVSFERFILTAYLQDILDASNHFLNRMSSGRYLLKTRDWETGGGLEIEVEDAYTGKIRSADTLSGGETFMAALSMAMGLSDTLQSKSGGIVLETIFIDEGFATLDPISLDKAVESLALLQSMHRGVGVISHVQGLKDRIDHKIQIEKTEQGSYIHIDAY